jgi:NitT/TauT family transport system permease protein
MTQVWVGIVNSCEPKQSGVFHWQIDDAHARMFPSYDDLAKGTARIFASPKPGVDGEAQRAIVEDSKASYTRLLWGIFYGVLFALLLGIHMGSFAVFDALLLPTVSFLSKIPPTAAMALFFAIVGLNEPMYVWIIAFGITPTLAMSIQLTVKDIPMELIHKAETLGASKLEIVWRVVFPTILPKVIDGVRLSIGPALVFLIAAEMLVGDVGIGYRIRLEQRKVAMAIVYFYLAYLAVFGLVIDKLLSGLQALLCPWFVPKRSNVGLVGRLLAGYRWLTSGALRARGRA